MMFRSVALTALLLASAAHAQDQMAVTAWTDLNLRAGPGPVYPIVAVIPAQTAVSVGGCLAEQSWCQVTYDGQSGWASGDYLTVVENDAPVAIYPNRDRLKVKTTTYEGDTAGNATAGGALGAVTGAIIAGPIGAAVGGAIGAASGAATTPETTVTTYVREHPATPVYLDGEVVTGAGLPETVILQPVPDTTYSYAYVNGVPVLVEQGQRRIIYIVR